MRANNISSRQFGELFLKYKDKFLAIAVSYIRDETAAEDIVVESFTNFWEKREEIELTTLPEAYIMTSVKNKCLNYLRDMETRMRVEQRMQDNAYKAVQAEISIMESEDMNRLFYSEVAKIFKNLMEAMPELTREIFYSSRFRDMTYNEIAEKYGVSPRKVKREIQKVLEDIRTSLKDYLPSLLILFPYILDK